MASFPLDDDVTLLFHTFFSINGDSDSVRHDVSWPSKMWAWVKNAFCLDNFYFRTFSCFYSRRDFHVTLYHYVAIGICGMGSKQCSPLDNFFEVQ